MTHPFDSESIEAASKAVYETDPDSGYREDDPKYHWRSTEWRKEVWDGWLKIGKAALTAAWASMVIRGLVKDEVENGR